MIIIRRVDGVKARREAVVTAKTAPKPLCFFYAWCGQRKPEKEGEEEMKEQEKEWRIEEKNGIANLNGKTAHNTIRRIREWATWAEQGQRHHVKMWDRDGWGGDEKGGGA
jgi:hypothetical protein